MIRVNHKDTAELTCGMAVEKLSETDGISIGSRKFTLTTEKEDVTCGGCLYRMSMFEALEAQS